MPLSERTRTLLLGALGLPEVVDELIADIETIATAEIEDEAVTTAKIDDEAVTNAKVASGIDAAKIGGGAVSNAEFAFLDGVSSAIQTQLNGKEPSITTLSIAKGGTNSSAALNNNRVLQSSGGAIVEAAAITASRALASDANGIPVHSSVTSTELGHVSGVTSAIQTQLDGKEPTITTLSVAKGGTNSGAALNNNRIVQSSGGAIVEAAAITASRALASDANGIPVAATTTAAELEFVNGVTSAIQTQIDGKQATGNYITALTGEVTASGPGSVAATIANNAVTSAKLATNILQFVDFTLSAAQMDALNATPITVVSAPAAGSMIMVDSIYLFNDFNTAAFELGAGVLEFRYTDAVGAQVVTDFPNSFVESGADASRLHKSIDVVPVDAAPIVAHASADVTAGDGQIKGRVYYRIVDTDLT